MQKIERDSRYDLTNIMAFTVPTSTTITIGTTQGRFVEICYTVYQASLSVNKGNMDRN